MKSGKLWLERRSLQRTKQYRWRPSTRMAVKSLNLPSLFQIGNLSSVKLREREWRKGEKTVHGSRAPWVGVQLTSNEDPLLYVCVTARNGVDIMFGSLVCLSTWKSVDFQMGPKWTVKIYFIEIRSLRSERSCAHDEKHLQTSCAGGRHNMPRPLQVDLWPFDVESGVRVTRDVAYLCANFSLPRPLCSRLRPDVRDSRQTRIIA